MEVISTTKNLRESINGMTVSATVKYGEYEGNKIDNGIVKDANGHWLTSWWLGRDNTLNTTFTSTATDRNAILAAIDAFVEAVSEE